MRAIVMHEFGGPDVLKYQEIDTPRVTPGRVLVKVEAVSINRTLDLLVREGKTPWPVKLPHIPGSDPSGVIVEIGADVTRRKVGDRVSVRSDVPCGKCTGCRSGGHCNMIQHIGVECWGGYADYVLVSEMQAFPIPDGIDFADATYFGRHFGMAEGQIDTARIKAGDTALVMAAAGALGMMVVQLLAARGVNVIAGAGSDDRVAFAKQYGAHHGINYRKPNWGEQVAALTGGKGVQALFDNIGDPGLWVVGFDQLAFGGTLVTGGYHGGGIVPLDVRRLHMKRLRVLSTEIGATDMDAMFRRALQMAQDGKIRAPIGARIPLSDAANAHRLVAASAIPGKAVLIP